MGPNWELLGRINMIPLPADKIDPTLLRLRRTAPGVGRKKVKKKKKTVGSAGRLPTAGSQAGSWLPRRP